MAKEISTVVKLTIKAGKATPAPPIGPALGQAGVNIPEFCKQFNAKTAPMGDFKVPVVITVYKDRSFVFELKTPPASDLLRKAAGLDKGSKTPRKLVVAKLSTAKLRELAEQKLPDLNAYDVEAGMKVLAGTARSMGIKIED